MDSYKEEVIQLRMTNRIKASVDMGTTKVSALIAEKPETKGS